MKFTADRNSVPSEQLENYKQTKIRFSQTPLGRELVEGYNQAGHEIFEIAGNEIDLSEEGLPREKIPHLIKALEVQLKTHETMLGFARTRNDVLPPVLRMFEQIVSDTSFTIQVLRKRLGQT